MIFVYKNWHIHPKFNDIDHSTPNPKCLWMWYAISFTGVAAKSMPKSDISLLEGPVEIKL